MPRFGSATGASATKPPCKSCATAGRPASPKSWLASAPQQGLVLLQQAYATATQHCERYFEPELCRLQGELLIHPQHPDRLHNQDQARDWFGRALAVAQDLQMPAFATRAIHSLSELAPEPAAQAVSS